MDYAAVLNQALAHHRAGQLQQAEALYRQILSAQPNHPEAMAWLGVIARDAGHLNDSLKLLEHAAAMRPSDASIRQNFAQTLRDLERLDEAIAQYEIADRLAPNSYAILNDLGVAYRRAFRYDDAMRVYQQALQTSPIPAPTLTNMAEVLIAIGRIDDAIAACDRAIALRPQGLTIFTKARALLLKGDLLQGFELYEQRLKLSQVAFPALPTPQWDGKSPPPGKSIAVVTEQGFGDMIMFARYLPMLKKLFARVALFCPEEIAPLLSTAGGVDETHSVFTAVSRFDFHVPLISLADRFATTLETIPQQMPYLRPDDAKVAQWRDRLGKHEGKKIGIAWSGRQSHPSNKTRSLALAMLAPLFESAGATFFSLQKDESSAEVKAFPRVVDLSDRGGFSDTAAIVSQLDLVIAVDTSIVHLAGALARPVWTLLPYEPDWRWMFTHPDSSPWYPTMRLFRQPKPLDWQSVMDRMQRELAQERQK